LTGESPVPMFRRTFWGVRRRAGGGGRARPNSKNAPKAKRFRAHSKKLTISKFFLQLVFLRQVALQKLSAWLRLLVWL